MTDKKNNQNEDNKNQNQQQDQKFSAQKNQIPMKDTNQICLIKMTMDGDEDENHYDDSVEKN